MQRFIATESTAKKREPALAMLGLALLAVYALLAYQIWDSYRNEIERAELTTRNYAASFETRLDTTFRHADRIILALARTLPPAVFLATNAPNFKQDLVAELDTRLIDFDELANLRILDARGQRLYASTSDSSEQFDAGKLDFFRELKDSPEKKLFFSKVYVSEKPPHNYLTLARAIRDAQGNFLGAVTADFDLEYYQRLFKAIDMGPLGSITFRRSDNQNYVTRWPALPDEINKPLAPASPIVQAIMAGKATASLQFTAQVDGVQRIAAIHALKNYPFYFIVGLARNDVLAEWQKNLRLFSVAAGLLLTLLPALFYRLWQSTRREKKTLADLTTSERRLRKESEDLDIFRRLTENTGQGIGMIQLNGMMTYANKSLRKMLDIGLGEDCSTYSSEQFFSEADRARLRQEIVPQVLAHGEWTGEFLLQALDGRSVPTLHNMFAIRDAEGKTIAMANVLVDLSERLQLEKRNRKLMAEMDGLLSNALVGIVHLEHRTVVSCNRRMEEMFGYSPGELIGKSSAIFYALQQDFDRIGEEAYRVVGTGQNYSTDMTLRHKDGSVFWGELTGRAIDPAHPQEGSIWVYADISERRAAEDQSRKLMQALAQSPVMIFITDRDGYIEYVNPAFARLTGFSEAEAIGENPRLIKSGEMPVEIYQDLWQTLLAGRVWTGQLLNRCKDGSLIWLDTSISPIRDEDGVTTHFLAIEENITARKKADTLLQERQEAFRRLFEDVKDPQLLLKDGYFVDCNNATLELLGFSSRSEFFNLRPADISPENQPDGEASDAKAQRFIAIALERGHHRFEWMHQRADGSPIPIEVTLTPITMSGEVILHTLWRDITERQAAETQLRLLAGVFQHSAEAILISDRNNCILEANPSFCQLTGYTVEEVRGKNPAILSTGDAPRELYLAMWESLRKNGFWRGEIWDRRKDGSSYPKWLSISTIRDNKGDVEYYIGSFIDISERKAAEERISHLAHFDTLTDLPNRFTLQGRLEQALAAARREGGRPIAVMFLDLDRFKNINDTLGHHVGDILLLEVAKRLAGCVRESDVVARLGGDEFVVLLTGVEAAQAQRVASKILATVATPYHLEGLELHASVSIGIAVYPEDGDRVDILMQNADAAMYHAKSAGRNNAQFFTASMNEVVRERHQLESDLHLAIERGEFFLHYQPQIEANRHPIGAEALVRWQHPTRGMVSPLKFVPLAEETGLILPIGRWVLETACQQIRRWADNEDTRHLQVAVNVSARQFRQPDFVDQVRDVLARTGATPASLKLELTESLVLDNVEETIQTMQEIKKLGVFFSMDDFGTGQSSLSYLTQLPLDQLKIDRAFVTKLPDSPSDAVIAQTIITMGRSLGLDVIAEGVETEAQCHFLDKNGCHAYQGYLFSKPLAADDFEAFITQYVVA